MEPIWVGGRSGKRQGSGQGQGQGRGRGKGRGKGTGKGNDKGNRKNGCEEVSRCMKKVTIGGPGKKGEDQTEAPPAYAALVMEENLRVAHANIQWLTVAASCINVKLLEKTRDSATPCVPDAAAREVNDLLLIHKSIMGRVNDIVVQVREMAVTLHVDATTFRDQKNKPLDPLVDDRQMTQLLIEDHLYYGGTPIRALLLINNEVFRDLIYQLHAATAEGSLSSLGYRPEDAVFAVTYDTDMGVYEVVFSVGVDGRAVQPQVGRPGASSSREVVLLSRGDIEQLEMNNTRTGTRSGTRSRTGSRLVSRTASSLFRA